MPFMEIKNTHSTPVDFSSLSKKDFLQKIQLITLMKV